MRAGPSPRSGRRPTIVDRAAALRRSGGASLRELVPPYRLLFPVLAEAFAAFGAADFAAAGVTGAGFAGAAVGTGCAIGFSLVGDGCGVVVLLAEGFAASRAARQRPAQEFARRPPASSSGRVRKTLVDLLHGQRVFPRFGQDHPAQRPAWQSHLPISW